MGWAKPSRPANFEAKTSTNKESDRWLSRKRLPARPQVEKKRATWKSMKMKPTKFKMIHLLIHPNLHTSWRWRHVTPSLASSQHRQHRCVASASSRRSRQWGLGQHVCGSLAYPSLIANSKWLRNEGNLRNLYDLIIRDLSQRCRPAKGPASTSIRSQPCRLSHVFLKVLKTNSYTAGIWGDLNIPSFP